MAQLCTLLAQPIRFVRESSSPQAASPIPSYICSEFLPTLQPLSTIDSQDADKPLASTFSTQSAPPILHTTASGSDITAHDLNHKQKTGELTSQIEALPVSQLSGSLKRKRPPAETIESQREIKVVKPTPQPAISASQAAFVNSKAKLPDVASHPDNSGRQITKTPQAPLVPKKETPSIRGRGYFNRSGTHCYRNASLQALGSIIAFRDLVSKHTCHKGDNPNGCVCCYLGSIFREHYKSNGQKLSPHEPPQLRIVSQFIGGTFARIKRSRQEDAHEYIMLLLDRLSTHSSKRSTQILKSGINGIFANTKITKILCLNPACKHIIRTRNTEELSIMLNIPKFTLRHQATSLDDCFLDYTKVERIADYKCEKCGHLGVKKRILFEVPPKVALIGLSRFRFGWSQGSGKDKRKVRFPETLVWDPYMQERKGRSKLWAIICHESSVMDSGHYYAIVYAGDNMWIKYDDEQVSRIKGPLHGLDQQWYMLLYTSLDSHLS
ncbi:hypothetical protein ABW19_dt0204507 [Dactylella cylindrospora]|nr:hypothetical protein ABW19_dt0204507 [Dactylella cylindrospora]